MSNIGHNFQRLTCELEATSPSRQRLPGMDKIQEYREKAAHARRLARAVADAVVREQLEIAAKEYEEIADQLSAEDGLAEVKCSVRGK